MHNSPGEDRPVVFAVATATERKACKSLAHADGATRRPWYLQTGIGPLNIERLAAQLTDIGAAGLVSIGTAGGLADHVPAGSVLLPKRIMRADRDALRVDRDWHGRIEAALSKRFDVRTDSLVTVDRVVRDPGEKRSLNAATGAAAVDMESADLAAAASRTHIPFITLRVVLDACEDAIPPIIAVALDHAGNPQPARVLSALLRHPGDLPGLLRIVARLRTASRVLQEVCCDGGAALLAP